MKQHKVLFCDLDVTLIDTISGEIFPKGVWDMKLKFGVLDAIKKLNPDIVCIVTNQGGIEKGFINKEHWLHKAHYICDCIEEYISSYTIFKYCTSNNKDDSWRKPNTGMLQQFMSEYKDKYTKSDCLMIGDASGKPGQFSDSDKKTAENFGIDYLDVEDFVELMNNDIN